MSDEKKNVETQSPQDQPNNVIQFPIERLREKNRGSKAKTSDMKEAKNLKKNSLLFSFGAPVAAVCISALGIALSQHLATKRFSGSSDGRGIASKVQPDRTRLSSEAQSRLIQELKSRRDFREIASIGITPTLIEKFQLELLEGKYQGEIQQGKVFQLSLREGENPVTAPDQEALFKSFSTVWPVSFSSYHLINTQMVKDKQIAEVIELRSQNRPVGKVEVTKDLLGRLLSLSYKSVESPASEQ